MSHSIYSPSSAKLPRNDHISGGSSSNSNEESTHYEADTVKAKKLKRFDPSLWEGVDSVKVSYLPAGIDGLCAYTIVKGASKKVNVLQTDGRKWKKSSQSSWRDLGLMRYADCQGSFKCENDKCPYRIQYGVINRTQVKKQGDMASCRVCGEEMVYVACPARRYLKIGKKNINYFNCIIYNLPIL